MPYPLGAVLDTIFQFADRNRNGRIDVGGGPAQPGAPRVADETRLSLKDRLMLSAAAKVKRLPLPAGDLKRFAPQIDANGDNALSRGEVRAFVTRMDANRDGNLDDDELREGLTRAIDASQR